MLRTAPIFVLLLGVWLLLSSVHSAQAGEEQYLVKDGAALAQIVIAEHPARMTRLAAAELQSNLEKISGAKLPIVTSPVAGKPCIYVGISDGTKKLGLETKGLRHGAYRMESGPGWLALLGADKDFVPVEPYIRSRDAQEIARVNEEWDADTGETFETPFTSLFGDYHKNFDVWKHDDAGTINAVYGFLRSLGARWYFPGELGEILPSLTTIKIPEVNKTVRADSDLRLLTYYHSRHGMSDDDVLWNLRMGLNSGHDSVGLVQLAHGMKFVMMRDEFKQNHPDAFALIAGKRATESRKRTGSPCLSSSTLFEKQVKFVESMFDDYHEPMISIDLPDGVGALCQDEVCSTQGTPERGYQGRMSDYVWKYLNNVALEVYKTHPDKMVSGLAYSGYQLPPLDIDQLSPNLAIVECRRRSTFHNEKTREHFRQIRQDWLKKLPSKQWYIWDYYLDARPEGALAGIPVYFPHAIAEDLHSLKGISSGDKIEVYRHPHQLDKEFSWHDLAIAHLNLYITSQFWWDADQNVDELLEEYYTLFYGPAREQMKAFIEYCEQNYSGMIRSLPKIDQALALLKVAQDAVKPDSIYAQRIALAADYMAQLEPLRARLAKGREGRDLVIPVVPADSDLKVDGLPNEDFWKDVPEVELRDVVTGAAPANQTKVRMAWGKNDELYLSVRCEDTDMAGVTDISKQDDDVAVWSGDFVELLIETPIYSYYQIAVSPSGHLLDINRRGGINTLWESGAKVATTRGEGYWQIEMTIPAAGETADEVFPDLGVSGDKPTAAAPWLINIGRVRIRGNTPELSVLSPTGKPKFHDPLKFGRLWVQE